MSLLTWCSVFVQRSIQTSNQLKLMLIQLLMCDTRLLLQHSVVWEAVKWLVFGSAPNSSQQVLTIFATFESVRLYNISPFCISVPFLVWESFFFTHIYSHPYNFLTDQALTTLSYEFKCTTFCCYSALNNAVCWKSMLRVMICLVKQRCCLVSE